MSHYVLRDPIVSDHVLRSFYITLCPTGSYCSTVMYYWIMVYHTMSYMILLYTVLHTMYYWILLYQTMSHRILQYNTVFYWIVLYHTMSYLHGSYCITICPTGFYCITLYPRGSCYITLCPTGSCWSLPLVLAVSQSVGRSVIWLPNCMKD